MQTKTRKQREDELNKLMDDFLKKQQDSVVTKKVGNFISYEFKENSQ